MISNVNEENDDLSNLTMNNSEDENENTIYHPYFDELYYILTPISTREEIINWYGNDDDKELLTLKITAINRNANYFYKKSQQGKQFNNKNKRFHKKHYKNTNKLKTEINIINADKN